MNAPSTLSAFLVAALVPCFGHEDAAPPREYHETFAAAEVLWGTPSGHWRAINGRLVQLSSDAIAAASPPYMYGDVLARVRLRVDASEPASARAGIGLFAGPATEATAGLMAAISAGGAVTVSLDGKMLYEAEGVPNPRDWHTLELQAEGDTIRVKLEPYPQQVLRHVGASSGRGAVQLFTMHGGASFDDLYIANNERPAYTPAAGRPTPTLPPLQERSIYCPAATTGAGGSLMQFWTVGELEERIASFLDLPALLVDARRMGSNTLYLVDWWDGHYSEKGDYRPSAQLGGPEALRHGIAAVHAAGGRVLLYVEPFIVHVDSDVGREHGAAWAIMNEDRSYRSYHGRKQYYVMYPGEGSGWTDYLAALCGALARDYAIDGIHLDSYGTQWDLRDYNPARPHGTDPERFNAGVVNLARRVRSAMREHVPHAVVYSEGAEHEALLDAIDGAQIESFDVLQRKPWRDLRRYRIFVADFDLRMLQTILDAGHNLALCDFWLKGAPDDRQLERLRRGLERGGARKLHQDFWQLVNFAVANNVPLPAHAPDPRALADELTRRQWEPARGERLPLPALTAFVDDLAPRVAPLRAGEHRLPADRIKEWLSDNE